ncbi:MAG TPA: DUF3800 domain-containing protein [Terriglobales bacterium]|nr:DUF3800 domain-containing protein [Terriglobales bacterium]
MVRENQECPTAEIARFLTFYPDQAGELAVLKFFGDESGIAKNSRICVVAGLLGSEPAWEAFDRDWSGALGDDIPAFHAVAINGGRDEFYGMDAIRRGDLLRKLATVIAESPLVPLVAGSVVPHFFALSELDRSLITNGHPDVPYWNCLDQCIVAAAVEADRQENERVNFIFERQDEFKKVAEARFDEMKEPGGIWSRSARLGEIAFSRRTTIPGIQAADLLAYEAFKHLENMHFRPELRPEWTRRVCSEILRPKLEIGKRAVYFTESTLRLLAAGIRERSAHA